MLDNYHKFDILDRVGKIDKKYRRVDRHHTIDRADKVIDMFGRVGKIDKVDILDKVGMIGNLHRIEFGKMYRSIGKYRRFDILGKVGSIDILLHIFDIFDKYRNLLNNLYHGSFDNLHRRVLHKLFHNQPDMVGRIDILIHNYVGNLYRKIFDKFGMVGISDKFDNLGNSDKLFDKDIDNLYRKVGNLHHKPFSLLNL